MSLVRGLMGGLAAAILTWVVILVIFTVRMNEARNQSGSFGLGDTAGGWTYLLHQFWVLVLLTVSFGLGLYLSTRNLNH